MRWVRLIVVPILIVAAVVAVVWVSLDEPDRGPGGRDGMVLRSPAFEAGGLMPEEYTADGRNISPPLEWSDLPEGTRTVALVVEDPDVPLGTYVHWLICDIPATYPGLDSDIRSGREMVTGSAIQGNNSARELGYTGPAPPEGETHRYIFRLYALDTKLEIQPGYSKHQLRNAVKGHSLGEAELVVRYGR